MSEPQKQKVSINLNLKEILDYGGGSLHLMFFKQPEEYAKRAFKAIKGGSTIPLGQLKVTPNQGETEAPQAIAFDLTLQFDYSEFKGPGFNFPTFKSALQAMLQSIAARINDKKEPNILHNQKTGGVLIHHPGFIQIGEQLNVMVLSVEPSKKTDLNFKLFFVDPSQYKRKDEADAATA